MRPSCLPIISLLCALILTGETRAADPDPPKDASTSPPATTPSANRLTRGYELLTQKAYLPPDFGQDEFDALWEVWEEPLRAEAAKASPLERTQLAYHRYGLTPRPDDPTKPLQYVVADGKWTMNCFACHGGKVDGAVVPGLPNSHYALETLTADLARHRTKHKKPLGRMELASFLIPLGRSNGTTNAVVFGVGLLSKRDPDLNLVRNAPIATLVHHDLEPPPWWNTKKKKSIYIDGFAGKNHRALMQFLLVPQNGPAAFADWERDFEDIYAWMHSLEPPKYPYEIDQALARQGEQVFNQHCSRCHGTYGANGQYPERMVPIAEVKTDPVRWEAIDEEGRRRYAKSWFAFQGKSETKLAPEGYVAPPLDGVWASAPYLHNGSVPTLWHLFYPDKRPVVWRRKSARIAGQPEGVRNVKEGYDTRRVGLEIESFDIVPPSLNSAERRQFFDTRLRSKSAAGHTFPDALTEPQKSAVLEYLKTL